MTVLMENVLRASSAVSFRVLDVSRNLKPADRLFQSEELNHTVIFKQPNFEADNNPFAETEARNERSRANGAQMNGAAENHTGAVPRPILTAIYVPRVREEPEIGGYGIFVGQQSYGELMQTYCGIDIEDSHIYGRDLEILRVLTESPSLDPFLLKASFADSGLTVNENYLNVKEDEEIDVREVIEQKVRPIIAEAYGEGEKDTVERKTQSFIDGIWDPRSTDANQFISAFRIEVDAIPEIFGAWKGVAFYQYQSERIQNRIVGLLTWLKGEASIPIDAQKLVPHDLESLMMFRKQVTTLVGVTYRNSRAILDECDESFDAFVKDGNPMKFRDFLLSAVDKYWVLGACNSALVMVTDIWYRSTQNGKVERHDAKTLRSMYAGMKAAMDCDGGSSGAIS